MEILIVLAVTAVLFISVITMVSGRQRQTEFNTAIRDVQSQLQQAISEVGNGFYPSRNNFNCTASTTGPVLSTVGLSKQQGTNEGCIFVGKVVQFGYQQPNQLEKTPVFSVVGLRQIAGSGDDVRTLAEARATVIAPADGGPVNMPDATALKDYKGGLNVKWVRINGVKSPTTDVGAIGFMNSLASGGSLSSGGQRVEAYPIQGTAVDPPTLTAAAKQINDGMAVSNRLSASNANVQVCIDSGTTKQSGLVTIGGNGRDLSVDLRIQGGLCSI